MPDLPISTNRVRAWIFGNIADLAPIKADLHTDFSDPAGWVNKKFFEIGGDDFVIVRVEEVTPFTIIVIEDKQEIHRTCNVVIPVDAQDDGDDVALKKAKNIIAKDLKIEIIKEVRVVGHNPWPPHKAHGFITPDEFYVFKDEHVGRQFHNSPGSNKWG